MLHDKSRGLATGSPQAVASMYRVKVPYIHLNLLEIHMQLLKNRVLFTGFSYDICSATPTSQAVQLLKSLLSLQVLQALLHLQLETSRLNNNSEDNNCPYGWLERFIINF